MLVIYRLNNYLALKQSEIFIALFCIMSVSTFAQKNYILKIESSEKHNAIAFAHIKTLTTTEYSNENGYYLWNTNKNPTITVSAWNYADTVLQASQFNNQDTLIIYLKPKPEQLNEILLKPENSWLQREVDAFERWQTPNAKGWLFLMNKNIYVTDELLNVLYKTTTPIVGGKKAKQLFQDVLGTNFLLGEDSVQQIYVTDTTLYLYKPRNKTVFNALIVPVLGKAKEGMVCRQTQEVDFDTKYAMRATGTEFTFNVKHPPLHNCGAIIQFKNKDSVTTIYNSIDSSAYYSAVNAFQKYIAYHIKFWYIVEDSGYFSPKYQKLKGKALHSYKTLFAQYKQTYWLPYKNNYVLIDPYGKQWVTFSPKLKAIKQKPFNFEDCPKEEYLYIDAATDEWWLQRRKRGLDTLYPIKPDSKNLPITLDAFVKNIRIYNNIVLYINQYGEFRVKSI